MSYDLQIFYMLELKLEVFYQYLERFIVDLWNG